MPRQNDTTNSVAPLLKLGQPWLDAWIWGMVRALRGWVTYQSEFAGFLAKRGHRNLEIVRQLSTCATWQDFAQLRQKWQAELGSDYTEELGRLVGTNLELAERSLAPLQGLVCPHRAEGASKPRSELPETRAA